MKTTKEELIDFLKWFHDNYDWEDDDIVVDDYLKYLESINSDLNESLSVTENEQAKEVCPICNKSDEILFVQTGVWRCGKCQYEWTN